MTRASQRGSAMLVTLIVISALLAGTAVLVSIQLSQSRSTEMTKTGLSALYCAEAGLRAARPYVASNYGSWNIALTQTEDDLAQGLTPSQPMWLSNAIFSHDLDNPPDNADDFRVWIADDDDETAGTNDRRVDTNQRVYVVSRCIKYRDTPKEVRELIEYTPTAQCYNSQEGGCNGRGNANQ